MKQLLLTSAILVAGATTTFAQGKKDKIQPVREFESNKYGQKVLTGEGNQYGSYNDVDEDGNYVTRYLRTGMWTFYNQDGKVSSRVSYRDNKINGSYTSYYANGKVMVEAKFKEGKPDGDLKKYYVDGKLLCSIRYDDGQPKGTIVRYYNSGAKMDEIEGMLDEAAKQYRIISYTSYYENGNKRLTGKCDPAKAVIKMKGMESGGIVPKGEWMSYWNDGKEATQYDFDKGTINVINTRDFDNEKFGSDVIGKGQKVLMELLYTIADSTFLIYFENGTELNSIETGFDFPVRPNLSTIRPYNRVGTWEYRNAKGNPLSKIEYDWMTDEEDGPATYYYANGKTKSEGTYKNGLNVGVWTAYFENGNKSETQPYNENGRVHGIDVEYFEDGSVFKKSTYVEGKLEGIMELFHPGGAKLGTYEYQNGKQIAVGELFDKNGNSIYKNGTGTRLEYYQSGGVLFRLPQKNGHNDGECTWYFENGKPKEVSNFSAGVLNGSAAYYFENGMLREKSVRVNGKTEGVLEFYHPNGKLAGKQEFRNGNFTGIQDCYDSNGKATLTNGTGYFVSYFSNGKLSYRASFINYCRDGKAEWYYPNGQLKQVGIYKYAADAKPNGLRWEAVSSFSPTGEKLDSGTLKNGNGTWKTYDDDGKYLSTNTYKGGR